jgi:CHAT domain-containing protein
VKAELRKHIFKYCLLIILGGTFPLSVSEASVDLSRMHDEFNYSNLQGNDNQPQTTSLESINTKIASLYAVRNYSGLVSLADSLARSLSVNIPDSTTLAELYYNIGISLLLVDKYNDALSWLNKCINVKEKLAIVDDHYANGIFDIGVAYVYLGDFLRVSKYMLKYIEIAKGLYGYYSPEVAGALTTLVSASLETNEYKDFRDYTYQTLEILNFNKNALQGSELARFYLNVGTGYARLADNAKARIYFEQAESIYNARKLEKDNNYINLINSLAITYGVLGFTDKAKEYFNRGLELAVTSNSFLAFNLIRNYALDLGNSGKVKSGEELIASLLKKSGEVYGFDSRFYIETLENYAGYLREYEHDYQKSIRYYLQCLEYIRKHDEDVLLREQIISGYAQSLSANGEHYKALGVMQGLLFCGIDSGQHHNAFENPDLSMLKADSRTLRLLRNKYEILWRIYNDSGDNEVLKNAALTSELIISLIDRMRINISEDESRMILGSNYRDSYLFAIRDFELYYRNTGDKRYLEKTFEFAEKSKAAGLLAATRELNAVNFNIPADISELEKSLQREIAFYNSRISNENEKEHPDRNLISDLNNNLLNEVRERDSLLLTFERDYPGYYAIKYSTSVLSMKDIPRIAGRNTNYLNYVVSDSVVYIFIANRKNAKILTARIDSSFFKKLRDFRSLLSAPDPSVNARRRFDTFQAIGYDLFKILIEPVRKYFISDELLISPDNILSYLPFETFLSSRYEGEGIIYRRLPYLMNTFSISYAYSASLMKESVERDYGRTHKLVAFAPVYTREIYLDSLSVKREHEQAILHDLPYARMEAEYVSDISGGTLYINENAKESVYKAVAKNYDIIHLAMHTYLNDQNPMNSAMIFTLDDDSPEDGFLNTYEVYGIPLKARMVVLSSCNTGSGVLSSGEGILSLARGFLYSGGQSVVMSMWEIEDKSGTEIVKMFYNELHKGKSKSKALKKARTEYLKKASQLKSHPYFWSSLIVYGDNSPVYPDKILIMIIIGMVIVIPVIYFLYRRYS